MNRVLRVSFVLLATFALAASANYKVAKTWKLGGDGGWDYLNVDSDGHRLFIARATRVMVVDTTSGKQVGEVPETSGVHGVAFDREINRGFASNGKEDTVSEFDLKSLAVEKKIKVGNRPDAILYDPFSKRVFTFNAGSKDTTAVDASKGEVAGKIDLGGKPEFAASDEKGTVFVNIEDTSELVAFDPQKLAVKSRWKLTGCEDPSGLAMDRKNRRLFVGCANKKMAIVNADDGKIVATPPIGDGCDATAFDADWGLAFASAGDGTITVVQEDGGDKFSVAQTITTQKGARTMAVDAKTHQLFTVTANVSGTRQDRKIEPDSFVVIEVEGSR